VKPSLARSAAMCQTTRSVTPSPQCLPARQTQRNTLPLDKPAAVVQKSSVPFTQSGTGTVRICPPLPTRSRMAQSSSRCWKCRKSNSAKSRRRSPHHFGGVGPVRQRFGSMGAAGTQLRTVSNFSLSPDEKRVVSDRITERSDLWISDLEHSTESRFTSDAARNLYPIWSPDGSKIIYPCNRAGAFNVYQRVTKGAGQDERLLDSGHSKIAWGLIARRPISDLRGSNIEKLGDVGASAGRG
jgi:hypothetical protein